MMTAIVLLCATAARAEPPLVLPVPAEPRPEPPVIGGTSVSGPCVEVDIAGHRAGQLDCATRRLQEAARIAQSRARAGIDGPVAGTGAPDAQVGVATLSGSRLRMGSALGRSVHPQRPNTHIPQQRPGGRP